MSSTSNEPIRALILPGLATSDRSTVAIRSSLALQGVRAHRWNLGTNRPTPELSDALRRRFFDLVERAGRPIALVGWSLGGFYAHRLVEFSPNNVRCVITLASPLSGGAPLPRLPVPTTSVYSRNDRVVNWKRSLLDDTAPRHENIEVRGNHFTIGFDPAVMAVIGDRVRRDPDRWKPFRAPWPMIAAFPSRPKD